MLKVAVNAMSLAPGGGLNVLLGLLDGWNRTGAQLKVTVYASRSSVLESIARCHRGIELIPVAVDATPAKHFVVQQTQLGRLIERSGAHVVLTTQQLVGGCRIPQVVHHQNLKRFLRPMSPIQSLRGDMPSLLRDWIARRSMKLAARNVFISDYLRRCAERFVPTATGRNCVIHNGATEFAVSPCTEKPLQHVLAAVQSDAAHKDTPTLIRTLAELKRRAPHVDWSLQIAGSGSWDSARGLAKTIGISNSIRFLGYIEGSALAQLFRRSLCLVFTSVLEGFGLPLIEGMAHGCPVIACDTTAMPEVVGPAGLLVPAGDHVNFADCIMRLYSDTALRCELIDLGRSRARQFTWTRAADAFSRVLETAAGEAPSAFAVTGLERLAA